jgi:dTDP-4-amino-4,6-dideoxygalactose transaminase
MEPYRSYFPNAGVLLPQTENVCKRVLILPTGQSVSPEDVSAVCDLIRFAVSRGGEIADRLQKPSKRAAALSVQ